MKKLAMMLWFFILLLPRFTSSANITSPPQDAYALINTTGVTFNCSGFGDLLGWTYDGSTIDDAIKEEHQISIVHHHVSHGMVSSSLYINATLANADAVHSGVAITCQIITTSNADIKSKNAFFYVRLISPVRELALYVDDVTEPHVNWTIPLVIEDNIEPTNIRYIVNLMLEDKNITSTASDINDTYYQFTDMTVLNCTVYNATVTAYDNIYQSHTSDNATIKEESMIDNCKYMRFTSYSTHFIIIIIIFRYQSLNM